MRLASLSVLALLLHTAGAADGPRADPVHLRYQRAIESAPAGNVCTVLDADVFAHAEGRAASDLRVYTSRGVETPFELTESSPAVAPTEPAQILNAGVSGDAVVFDLRMPPRTYSEVDLDLDARNFVAVAEVSADRANEQVQLGTFTLFALESQHLSRSTTMPLQEAVWPVLHVKLHFHDVQGKTMLLPASVVRGADVPPSREAQTVYTTVASTTAITQKNRASVAVLHVPARVPVERASVVLDPAFSGNFVRTLSVDAHDGEAESPDHVEGEITRTNLKPANLAGAPPIRVEHLGVDAVLAANLHDAADVAVSIANGDDQPLPIRAIELAMRQRKVCFHAGEGQSYTLRYGDAALSAPQYDFARLFDVSSPTRTATLGSEQANPQWTPRADVRPFTERHPQMVWIALFGVVAILGATALASVRGQHSGR